MRPHNITYLPISDEEMELEPLMRFRLFYDGELRSNQKHQGGANGLLAKHKHEIRKCFHRQLKMLWETNQFLKDHEVYPTDSGTGRSSPSDAEQRDKLNRFGRLPLVEAVARQYVENGFRFVPLVRKDYSLLCGLNILFLRRDYPGAGVITAGDIDNRVKTLIDALRKPCGAAELGGLDPEQNEDPFFCLLENDDLVTSLSVETDSLLSPPRDRQNQANFARIIITIDLRPYNVTMFNLGFG